MPPCQLRGREAHVYTGYQLPFDPHEWDYNSWYDTGHQASPPPAWYLEASRRQQQRHNYVHAPACADCALRQVCDGFHAQYVARWGGDEAAPYAGKATADPRHFIRLQDKIRYVSDSEDTRGEGTPDGDAFAATRLPIGDDGRAGVRRARTPVA
jgi:hypothetical protein